MKIIQAVKIKDTVADLCIKANLILRKDALKLLKSAYARETSQRAKKILKAIIENASVAQRRRLAICQDTGMPQVFLEVGQDLRIIGDLKSAINQGVELGYKKASLRDSIVANPLSRGTPERTPAVIHTDIVQGDKIKITVLPKGFGCENKSQLKMFKPTAGIEEIKKFIVDAVKSAGPDACPPYVIGVGIGGSADYAGIMAKKALLTKISAKNSKLEDDLLKQINRIGIGPMGLGGRSTALAVKIQKYPTHIAGLPVSVNISCHALRSASVIL